MPRFAAGLVLSAALTGPVLAQSPQAPPPGVYRCTSAERAPVGVLTVRADGSYLFQAVSDADFTIVPEAAANGEGALVATSENSVKPQSGPLEDHYGVTGTVSSAMGLITYRFTDASGAVALVCSP